MALPLALFILGAVLWPEPKPQVVKVESVDIWVQPLGRMPMSSSALTPHVQAPPDLNLAQWTAVQLPYSQTLPAQVDLPDDAPKNQVWFRVRLPKALGSDEAMHKPGQLGLMGNRIMGGPWAVWVNGQLVQTSLLNWRIAWSMPMRVSLPLGTGPELTHSNPEILISVLHPQAKGFAIGSLFLGPIEDIDQLWHDRNAWHIGVSTVTSAVALAMTLVCLQLAWMRRQDKTYVLLTLTAFMWLASGFQYTHDFAWNDALSVWYGWAVDASINWIIVLSYLFAFAFEGLHLPRLKLALLVYAVFSTLITLPVWSWDKNALVLQHVINTIVFTACALVLTRHAWRKRTRESVLIALSNWVQFFFGIHDVFSLTNQSNPDTVQYFQISSVLLFAVFMYITNRRYVMSLTLAEQHEQDLKDQLQAQAVQLAQQHQDIQQLVLAQELARQRQAFSLDLHDRIGNLLATAKRQAHEQALTQNDLLAVLEDIGHEVRDLSSTKVQAASTIGQCLADMRQRMQPRLDRLGLVLKWRVSVDLPERPILPEHTQTLRALLSEAVGNILKHAGASQIEVSTACEAADIVIRIRDNGQGFDPLTTRRGRGLDSMQTRAQQMGAGLHIHSKPGQGTEWCLRVPVKG